MLHMSQEWVSEIDKDKKLFIEEIHIQSIDMFGSRLGFVKFKTVAKINVGGKTGVVVVPGIVFMRGGAVGILVILECEGEEYTILTRQARVPVGVHDLPEIPAGMLDGSGNFKGVAAEEIREECDIEIQEKELVDLTYEAYGETFKGMIPSAGGCDEFVRLYMLRREVDKGVIEQLQGRLTGLASEGERITLQIIKLADMWRITPDGKALTALVLMDNLKRHQMMPKNRAMSMTAKEVNQDSLLSNDGTNRSGRVSQAWSMTSSQDRYEHQ
jgi:ADP-sugar diphosphatase